MQGRGYMPCHGEVSHAFTKQQAALNSRSVDHIRNSHQNQLEHEQRAAVINQQNQSEEARK